MKQKFYFCSEERSWLSGNERGGWPGKNADICTVCPVPFAQVLVPAPPKHKNAIFIKIILASNPYGFGLNKLKNTFAIGREPGTKHFEGFVPNRLLVVLIFDLTTGSGFSPSHLRSINSLSTGLEAKPKRFFLFRLTPESIWQPAVSLFLTAFKNSGVWDRIRGNGRLFAFVIGIALYLVTHRVIEQGSGNQFPDTPGSLFPLSNQFIIALYFFLSITNSTLLPIALYRGAWDRYALMESYARLRLSLIFETKYSGPAFPRIRREGSKMPVGTGGNYLRVTAGF